MTNDNSDTEVNIFMFMLFTAIILSSFSCHRGYQWGYDQHRETVCQRSGGVWVVVEDNEKRRACVTGARR